MRTISVFNHVTVDGFFAGPHGEMDWFQAIKHDDEYSKFSHEASKTGDTLIFGRTTYEIMKRYWPTPGAIRNDPEMAGVMHNIKKIVFSKTLKTVEEGPNWKNIKLYHEIVPEDILKLKEQPGKDITILGSGTIVQQFSDLGLIDAYGLVVVPIVLGAGKSMFKDIKKTDMKLVEARSFNNGVVMLIYTPNKKLS